MHCAQQKRLSEQVAWHWGRWEAVCGVRCRAWWRERNDREGRKKKEEKHTSMSECVIWHVWHAGVLPYLPLSSLDLDERTQFSPSFWELTGRTGHDGDRSQGTWVRIGRGWWGVGIRITAVIRRHALYSNMRPKRRHSGLLFPPSSKYQWRKGFTCLTAHTHAQSSHCRSSRWVGGRKQAAPRWTWMGRWCSGVKDGVNRARSWSCAL